MGLIGGEFGYRMLRRISPAEPAGIEGDAYCSRSKLDVLLGSSVWPLVRGRIVMDFGCGNGSEVIELAQRGAGQVFGIEIQGHLRASAIRAAARVGVAERVCFLAVAPDSQADVVISLDSFEHFSDPEGMLLQMHRALRPGGLLLISFGPTWFHPNGGHLFSVFPWAHLIFTEAALIRWRSDIRTDGATKFSECAGGLNQMTIRRFERMVHRSDFEVQALECVPIRRMRPVAFKWNREFTTSIVRARLRRSD